MPKQRNFTRIRRAKNLNTIYGLPPESYTDDSFWKKECNTCLLYTSPSPRDLQGSRMPSSA